MYPAYVKIITDMKTTAAANKPPNMNSDLNSDFDSIVCKYFNAATATSNAKTPKEKKQLKQRNITIMK